MPTIKVIIPAFNEEKSIAKVIADIPDFVEASVVVNNNSTDQTALVAAKAGATVLTEKSKGYGYACLKGINYLSQKDKTPDILVFLDGDFSDFPQELTKVIQPIKNNNADFVVGARVKELRESGSLTPQQVFGNWLACFLMKILYKSSFTDLGPFRAIRWSTLEKLQMSDKTYGWTIEMQLKVYVKKLLIKKFLSPTKRIGVSKVSGTVKGLYLQE